MVHQSEPFQFPDDGLSQAAALRCDAIRCPPECQHETAVYCGIVVMQNLSRAVYFLRGADLREIIAASACCMAACGLYLYDFHPWHGLILESNWLAMC